MKQMAMPGAGQSQPERHTAVWGQVQLAPSVLIAVHISLLFQNQKFSPMTPKLAIIQKVKKILHLFKSAFR